MTETFAVTNRRGKRQQIPDEVATYARELIISGAIRPGEFLRMDPIAETMGVSYTPVREGLLILEREGFVKMLPRRGFVVESFTQQDVRDLFFAQAHLAGELAARTAQKITPEQVTTLQALVEQYEKAAETGDEELLASLGHAFHREINLAADSPRLTSLLGYMVKNLPNRFYTMIAGGVDSSRIEHPLLLEALRKHHARKARTLMEQHILARGDQLVAILEERGIWNRDEPAS
ncbi:GntR family transcriptional regulator [Rhodococcus koreensis]|uniref:GntR family transcriptional regulator n=1 Tax=Rhodococcus sp. T2V TaxID=3034164 RepID=UPI0023E1A4F7|nr:GntR family transcriptional regulator [Rhodococcus sp. T2V]MDF3310784.1 GntR family transcriptional regulator [Rhodococcus sp. T2V]